jgi:hypothetical protein
MGRSISQAWANSQTASEGLTVDDAIDETSDAAINSLAGGAGTDLFIINSGDVITNLVSQRPIRTGM